MRYLFWNTNKEKGINNYIIALVEKYQPNIFALAEYDDYLMSELIQALKKKGLYYYEVKRISSRIWIFTSFSKKYHTHGPDAKHYTIKLFPYNQSEKQIIVFLHLPSKLYDEDGTRKRRIIHNIKEDVYKYREKRKINKVVYVGDFNLNPFEDSMLTAEEFQAVSSRRIAGKRSRELDDMTYEFLYNPMWNLFGDKVLPSGTYYYSSARDRADFWNMFDQFLVSPELIDEVDIEKVEIVTDIGNVKLYKRSMIPDISDHFPIYFEIGG